jgi:predicted outer membrane protein
MGLTQAKIKDLEDKKFDKLYQKHKIAWLKMVEVAFDFAKVNITGGAEPRPDDVLKTLLGTLEVSKDLRDHQEDVRARYKRYREFFGEYIIDQYLIEQQQKQKQQKGPKP